MVGQNEIDNSNIALLNSDLALEVRKAAAESEKEFEGAGAKEGIEIWRVENLGVKRWPAEQYGKFFSGDSYIVLHSYKERSDRMLYNVHFWLGESTTQDEAAVAAWKTVELDDRLGQLPVQYREVQGHESDIFLELFDNKGGVIIMEGGIDSGFSEVKPTEYKPRLLHVKGKRKAIRVKQVALSRESLNAGDVFILDNGLQIWQWNGSEAGVFEKRKGNQCSTTIREDRQGRPSFRVLDGDEECEEFWTLLGGRGDIKSAAEGGDDAAVSSMPKRLMRLSDASGKLVMTEVSSGSISKSDLDPNDVFLVDDSGLSLFVWVGSGASHDERAKGFQYANQYIADNDLPLTIPVSRVTEGNTSTAFEKVFG